MDNLDKKDIDYIFQEGSEYHNFPFKESSWDKMDALLSQQERRRAIWMRSLILLLFVFIGLGSFLYYNSNKTSSSFKKEHIALEKNLNNKEEQIENEIIDIKTNSSLASKEENILTPEPKIRIKTEQLKTSTAQNEPKRDKLISTKKNLIIPIVKNQKEASPITDLVLQKENLSSLMSDQESIKNIKASKVETKKLAQNQSILFTAVDPSLETLPISKVVSKEDEADFEVSTPRLKESRFKLGLVVGNEWSSVGFMSKKSSAQRIGLELAYQFANKFQIASSFILSKKNYVTQIQNYSPEISRWVDNIEPEMVNGSCSVYEIPLEASYFFKGYKRSGLYFSAGLNTYLLRTEWYDFMYEDQFEARPELPRTWSENGTNKHFFSVGIFSLGYQKLLTKNSAIQLAPYIQIPLTGIGSGQVDLVSTGIQMKLGISR